MQHFSHYYFRYLPSQATKQRIRVIHKNILSDLNKIEIELGIIIKLFVIGSIMNNFVEILSIQSIDILDKSVLQDIIVRIQLLEQLQLKENQDKIISEIESFGFKRELGENNNQIDYVLQQDFKNWNMYTFCNQQKQKYQSIDIIKISEVNDISFIGNYFSIDSIKSPIELIQLKLYEQLWNNDKDLLATREKGYCYSTVAKFHEELSVFVVGAIASYNVSKQNYISNILKNRIFSNMEIFEAKMKLKNNIRIATSLNNPNFTLFPFWFFNNHLTLEDIWDFIDEADVRALEVQFLESKFICSKIGAQYG